MYNLDLWKKQKKALNLTLSDIADKTGISISTIKDIFRGETYAPRIDTVEAIEKVLGINGLTTEEIEAGARTLINRNITAEEYEILNIYREIGERFGNQAQRAYLAVGENMLNIK